MSDAKRWASSIIVELAQGEGVPQQDEQMTLGDAVELFLSTKIDLEPNSYLAYKNSLSCIRPFSHIKLAKLDATTTQKIVASASSGYLKYLQIFWRYMLKMDLIKKSYLQISKPKPEKKIRVFTSEELAQINEIRNHEARVFCIVAYQLGLRAGEVLGLTPNCVKKNKIIIRQQWGRVSAQDPSLYGFKVLKNGDDGIRELPSNLEIFNALHSLPFNFAEGRFFTANKGDFVRNSLRGIGLNHSPHDFRHTRASEMVHAGFNLKYVAYFLGDKLETIIKTYVSLSADMLAEQEEKYVQKFF